MLETRYATIGFLKKLAYGILTIKKEYSEISDDYCPSYSEITDGKYFPIYKDNELANKIIIGLEVEKVYQDVSSNVEIQDIVLKYPKLSSLLISNDMINICPCGGECEIKTIGFFKIIKRSESIETCIEERKCPVRPLLKVDNNSFRINGNTVSIDKNTSEKRIEGLLTATYIYSGITHSNTLIIRQEPNTISDWVYNGEIIDSIKIDVSKSTLSSQGDTCTFSIKKYYTKRLVRKDSCGNILNNTVKSGYVDDITALCSITLSNNVSFKRDGNIISVNKQELNSGERQCIITAKYGNFVSSVKIVQERGGEITYGYTLSYEDGSLNNEYTLNNCFKQQIQIPIKSTKDMYIDDIYYSSINYLNLRLINDDSITSDWVTFSISELQDGKIYLMCDITKPNLDRENFRDVSISYQNIDDPNSIITFTLHQPYCKKINTKYSIIASGFDTYDSTTIKDCKLTVCPLIQDVYEDGRIEVNDIIDTNLYFTYDYSSTDKNILDGGFLKQISFDGTHQLTILYDTNNSVNDVILSCNFYLRDVNHDILAKCEGISMRYLHENVTTSSYLFKFEDNDSDSCSIEWDYDDFEKKYINVSSLKKNYVNGFEGADENVDFNIMIENNDGKFSVKNIDNKILEIRPLNVDNDTLRKSSFVIKQNISNKKLHINLTHFKALRTTLSKLMIYLSSNERKCDIWLENKPKCVIMDNNKTKLKEFDCQRGWVSTESGFMNDLIFSEDIELEIGKQYYIEISNLVYSTQEVGGNKIEKKTYSFVQENNNDDIVIEIKI